MYLPLNSSGPFPLLQGLRPDGQFNIPCLLISSAFTVKWLNHSNVMIGWLLISEQYADHLKWSQIFSFSIAAALLLLLADPLRWGNVYFSQHWIEKQGRTLARSLVCGQHCWIASRVASLLRLHILQLLMEATATYENQGEHLNSRKEKWDRESKCHYCKNTT